MPSWPCLGSQEFQEWSHCLGGLRQGGRGLVFLLSSNPQDRHTRSQCTNLFLASKQQHRAAWQRDSSVYAGKAKLTVTGPPSCCNGQTPSSHHIKVHKPQVHLSPNALMVGTLESMGKIHKYFLV